MNVFKTLFFLLMKTELLFLLYLIIPSIILSTRKKNTDIFVQSKNYWYLKYQVINIKHIFIDFIKFHFISLYNIILYQIFYLIYTIYSIWYIPNIILTLNHNYARYYTRYYTAIKPHIKLNQTRYYIKF